jgi:hypothetical protein
MTIHTGGALGVTAADFQTTHKGVAIAVKVIAWPVGLPVISLLEKKAAGWESTRLLYEFDDANTPITVTQKAGGTVSWIKTVLLAAINAALAERFKPDGAASFPMPGSLEDIDAQLGKVLAWAPQPDGTLRVVAK